MILFIKVKGTTQGKDCNNDLIFSYIMVSMPISIPIFLSRLCQHEYLLPYLRADHVTSSQLTCKCRNLLELLLCCCCCYLPLLLKNRLSWFSAIGKVLQQNAKLFLLPSTLMLCESSCISQFSQSPLEICLQFFHSVSILLFIWSAIFSFSHLFLICNKFKSILSVIIDSNMFLFLWRFISSFLH